MRSSGICFVLRTSGNSNVFWGHTLRNNVLSLAIWFCPLLEYHGGLLCICCHVCIGLPRGSSQDGLGCAAENKKQKKNKKQSSNSQWLTRSKFIPWVGGRGLCPTLSSFRVLMAALLSGILLAAMFGGREDGKAGTGSPSYNMCHFHSWFIGHT